MAHVQKTSKEGTSLSNFVVEECNRRGLEKPFQDSLKEPLNEEEELSIKQISFPDDLKFSVAVDLAMSKKAFLAIISGLNDDPWEDIWKFKVHDPQADYYPNGKVDVSFLTTPTPNQEQILQK